MRTASLALATLCLGLTACAGGRAAPRSLGHHPGPLQARTAFVTQEVDGETQAKKHRAGLRTIVEDLQGLILSESAELVKLRVPEAALDDALRALAELAPITESTQRAPEVSGVVTDLRVRVQTNRALRDRLVALLERASTVEEILAVERELGRVTETLALAEVQLAAQEGKVSFAEVHVRVDDPPTPGPVGWVFYGLFKGVKWLFVWD